MVYICNQCLPHQPNSDYHLCYSAMDAKDHSGKFMTRTQSKSHPRIDYGRKFLLTKLLNIFTDKTTKFQRKQKKATYIIIESATNYLDITSIDCICISS